jgi:uncharacterized membrane protein YjfL (UPF0719 family)
MTLSELSTIIYDSLVYIALTFVIFFIGKLIYQIVNPSIKVKEELVKKDNLAFSLAHVGYFVGLLLAIGGAIIGPTKGLVNDIIDISAYGILAIILLNLSVVISDKVLLRKFSVRKEIIEDRNAGTGIIEGAVSIASGLIILGAVSGETDGGLLHGILSALIFWFIGQIALLIASIIYNVITPFDVHEHIEKDNVAVGIGFAGALIAIANLIRFGLSGDFESWQISLTDTGIELLIGLVLLPVMRFLSDKILLPGERLTDEIINQEKPNIGAAIIEAFSYIGGSIIITWCL